MSEPLEHRGLPPMEHRGPGGDTERVLAVIKEARSILHIADGPVGYLDRKGKRLRIFRSKVCERVDRLGRTLNVDGVGAIVVILRAPGLVKEMRLEKPKAPSKLPRELGVASVLDVALQAVQIVARVEIVNPVILVVFGIPPSAVREHA